MIGKLRYSFHFIFRFISQLGGFRVFLRKAKKVFHEHGLKGVLSKIRHILRHASQKTNVGIRDKAYQKWLELYFTTTPDEIFKMQKTAENFALKPKISVIMPTFNSNIVWIKEAIESIRSQTYPHWELCIADDASTDAETIKILRHYHQTDSRIKVVFRKENGHISVATNSALEMATGDFVTFLDHDDQLSQDALFWVADMINQNSTAALIYSDEDKIDFNGRFSNPYFKCDWNYQLFLSQNLISHLGVYKTEIVKQIGGFRRSFEGSQDYDLALRFIEQINPKQIFHIPRVLYHWRLHNESTSLGSENKPYAVLSGQKAIAEHLKRTDTDAEVLILPNLMYRVKYRLPQKMPFVSIIIPTKNNLQLLKKCIQSIIDKTDYPKFEIIIVDNNSDDPKLSAYFEEINQETKIRLLKDLNPFNFSAINNKAASAADGEFLLFMNDDTEVINPDWLSEMVSIANQPGVGVVGARLWYPNDTLQHGGVFLGVGGVGSHAHKHLSRINHGYFERAILLQEFSAVTAACMLVKKSLFEEVGMFDEKNLSIAFNDVDLCLKLKTLGYRIVWTPYAELYHHESVSRGNDFAGDKWERFKSENEFMLNKWNEIIQNDPAYSPNLSLKTLDLSLAWPPRIKHF